MDHLFPTVTECAHSAESDTLCASALSQRNIFNREKRVNPETKFSGSAARAYEMAEIIAHQAHRAMLEAVEAWRSAAGTPMRITMARVGLSYFADAKRAQLRRNDAWAAKVREWAA